MKTIQVYQELKQKVSFLYQKLKLFKYEKTKGRKLAISIVDTITLALYRQASSRATKKSIWNDFRKTLKCSYKTLVVNLNKCSILCLYILKSTIPRCLHRSIWLKTKVSKNMSNFIHNNRHYSQQLFKPQTYPVCLHRGSWLYFSFK